MGNNVFSETRKKSLSKRINQTQPQSIAAKYNHITKPSTDKVHESSKKKAHTSKECATSQMKVEDRKYDKYQLHIAIDIGADGIGLAYAIDGKVFVHQDFNSQKFGASIKPKTIVLLDNEGDVNSFGIDAQFMLSTISITAHICILIHISSPF